MIRCHIFTFSNVGRENSFSLKCIEDVLEALYQRLIPHSDKALYPTLFSSELTSCERLLLRALS